MSLKRTYQVLFLVFLGVNACTGLKYVPEKERLYTGTKIISHKADSVRGTSSVLNQASDIGKVKPNTSLLGIRFGLWWHYQLTGKSSKVSKWLYKKLAEEPVYLSQTKPKLVVDAVDAMLYNHGFFDSHAKFEIVQNEKTASLRYDVFLNQAYRINKVIFPNAQDKLSIAILNTAKDSRLKPGKRYDLEALTAERSRIFLQLKENGFYFLGERDLIFSADTSSSNRTVDIRMKVKEGTSEQAVLQYKVGEVNIYADYQLGVEKQVEKRVIDTVNYYSEINYVKPAPILRSVFLKNNKIYNSTDQNLTYSRLMGLGIYKYVNVQLVKSDSSTENPLLKANIQLVPLPKKSISLEMQGVAKSNNFIGPGLTVTHRNRNTFKGAELFVLGIRTSFETQLYGAYEGQFSYEFNPKAELYVPRFITPFPIHTRSLYVPKTKFIAEFNRTNRVNYFTARSFSTSYGYKWKSSLAVDHDLGVANVTYFNIGNESEDFLAAIAENPLLQRRFEKQLIAGLAYSFTFNQKVFPQKRRPFYFNVNFESSGNIISGYYRLFTQGVPNATEPLKLAGVPYSQFVKLDVDIRQYLFFGKDRHKTLAGRIMGGWGLPYTNSSTMPYIKQYFSGGSYSLRGFPAYSVGPGTYFPAESTESTFFLQQGGEIKLEANLEFRFPVYKIMKGALFVDAGNTWLNNENPEVPGGKFTSSFYKELAADIGMGLRADIQFFVLRLDLGLPIRKPWLPEDQRWVLPDVDLGSKAWRQDNLILNLSFGYPF